MVRQARTYLAGAVSGTALIAVGGGRLRRCSSRCRRLSDWPLAALGGGIRHGFALGRSGRPPLRARRHAGAGRAAAAAPAAPAIGGRHAGAVRAAGADDRAASARLPGAGAPGAARARRGSGPPAAAGAPTRRPPRSGAPASVTAVGIDAARAARPSGGTASGTIGRRQRQRLLALGNRRPRRSTTPSPASTKRPAGRSATPASPRPTEEVVDGVAGPGIGRRRDGRQDRRKGPGNGRRACSAAATSRGASAFPSQCRPMPERGQAGAVADPIAGSPVYPLGSRVNERGHLEVGGCDVVELAAEFGTPAYVYAEDDMRARARAYREAFARRARDFEVLFASKAFPCTAAYRLFAEEGLSVDVASGGELHMALRAGFDPARIHMHGNNKTAEEILFAARAGVGHLILDSFDEIERCERLLDGRQDVLIRVTPGIKPSTHDYIKTGQLDSKFGFGIEDGLAARAIERVLGLRRAQPGRPARPHRLADLRARALHAAIGRSASWPATGAALLNVGGGLGIAYTADDEPPSIDAYVEVKVARRRRGLRRGVRDPDRAGPLAGRQRRPHRLPRRHGQGDPRRAHLRRRRRRHVRQPAADALRLPLRGADRRPRRRPRRTRRRRRRHALRVRRRARPRRDARRARPSATSSSPRRPAPTATRWRTTTTASRARR